jgi:hypothetical protein
MECGSQNRQSLRPFRNSVQVLAAISHRFGVPSSQAPIIVARIAYLVSRREFQISVTYGG